MNAHSFGQWIGEKPFGHRASHYIFVNNSDKFFLELFIFNIKISVNDKEHLVVAYYCRYKLKLSNYKFSDFIQIKRFKIILFKIRELKNWILKAVSMYYKTLRQNL